MPQGVGLSKLRSFWRGIGATLAKDVPFAAGYWTVFEPLRSVLLSQPSISGQEPASPPSGARIYFANAVAGFLAAAATAGATTPLDVLKTHAQMGAMQKSMAQTLSETWARGGLRSLFVGVGPRSARAGCAYAILMSSYEAFKSLELRSHFRSDASVA